MVVEVFSTVALLKKVHLQNFFGRASFFHGHEALFNHLPEVAVLDDQVVRQQLRIILKEEFQRRGGVVVTQEHVQFRLKFRRVRFVTCRQVENDAAEGPDVGFEAAGQLLEGLRRAEAFGGALGLTGPYSLLLDHELDSNPEIEELELVVFPGQHDVVRLQIFVDNFVRLEVHKSIQKLPPNILQLLNRANAKFFFFHIICKSSPINFFENGVKFEDFSSGLEVAPKIEIFYNIRVLQILNYSKLKNPRNHFFRGVDFVVEDFRIFVSA